MRFLLMATAVLGLAAFVFLGVRFWQYSRLWPNPSDEVVELTPEKRVLLQRLKAETKFQPNDYPPLGYTGAETPEDQARATAAVNRVIDAVLIRSDGPIDAKALFVSIGKGMHEVGTLATEDRDRTQGYMLEIWYILGFKGATGLFAYGSAYPKPVGYGEPLPPGWIAPDKPRPID
jgi:Domain of unknown function (DUF4844)